MAPDGTIGHAEIQIGDSVIMIADEYPDLAFLSPKSVGGTPVLLHVYVEDVDSVFARAVAAGATVRREVRDEFLVIGSASSRTRSTIVGVWPAHIEEVSPEEMARRASEIGSDAETLGLESADTVLTWDHTGAGVRPLVRKNPPVGVTGSPRLG